MDEGYSLNVTAAAIRIRAPTVWGALHALTTLEALTRAGTHMEGTHMELEGTHMEPCATVHAGPLWIVDQPRFSHRGVMVDPNRNYLPVPLLCG